jgi:Calcineurin-like phosphoesterase
MKIWFISDTHNKHEDLKPPKVDLVIHCGDESESGNAWMNESESRRFLEWYSALDIPTKIFIPGNHSTAIEQGLIRNEDYPKITFLIHAQTEWNGFKIFGSPYTPRFFDVGTSSVQVQRTDISEEDRLSPGGCWLGSHNRIACFAFEIEPTDLAVCFLENIDQQGILALKCSP